MGRQGLRKGQDREGPSFHRVSVVVVSWVVSVRSRQLWPEEGPVGQRPLVEDARLHVGRGELRREVPGAGRAGFDGTGRHRHRRDWTEAVGGAVGLPASLALATASQTLAADARRSGIAGGCGAPRLPVHRAERDVSRACAWAEAGRCGSPSLSWWLAGTSAPCPRERCGPLGCRLCQCRGGEGGGRSRGALASRGAGARQGPAGRVCGGETVPVPFRRDTKPGLKGAGGLQNREPGSGRVTAGRACAGCGTAVLCPVQSGAAAGAVDDHPAHSGWSPDPRGQVAVCLFC